MRAYRALLHLYPSSFRREYGADLAADFMRRRRDRSGVGGIALWVAAIADVIANAARLHLELLRQDLKYRRDDGGVLGDELRVPAPAAVCRSR